MNQSVYSAIASALQVFGLMALCERLSTNDGAVVLALHRILPESERAVSYNPHLVLSPESLEATVSSLRDRGARFVSLPDLLESAHEKRRTLTVALTFDDGWEDNHRHAFPVLRRLQVSATIFVVTDLIGSDQTLPEERWWRIWKHVENTNLRAELSAAWSAAWPDAPLLSSYDVGHQWLKWSVPIGRKQEVLSAWESNLSVPKSSRPAFMDWEQVNEMARANVVFGSHTRSHCVLPVESDDGARQELIGSMETLTARLGSEVTTLAYPNGGYTRKTMELARGIGYKIAVTTETGLVPRTADPLAVPRIALDDLVVNNGGRQFSAACLRLHLLRSAAAIGRRPGY